MRRVCKQDMTVSLANRRYNRTGVARILVVGEFKKVEDPSRCDLATIYYHLIDQRYDQRCDTVDRYHVEDALDL